MAAAGRARQPERPQTNSNHDPTITCRQQTSIRWRNGCATKGRNTAASANASPTSLASTPGEDNNWATEQGLDDSHLSEQGLRAREERRAMELSQTELAEIEGITANKICRRETERLTRKAKMKEEKNK